MKSKKNIMRRDVHFEEAVAEYIAAHHPVIAELPDKKTVVMSVDGAYQITIPHRVSYVRTQAARLFRRWLLQNYTPSVITMQFWYQVKLSYQASCVINGVCYYFDMRLASASIVVLPVEPEPLFRLLNAPEMGPFIKPKHTT